VQFGQDELRFLDTSTGQRRRQPVTAAFTRDVAFHPAGSVLLSCDAGRSEIQFWDTTLLEPGIQIEGCPTGNCALALTPDGQALVAAGKDGLIRAWHAPRPFPLEQ
jgi:WD40 repeat protein